MVSNSKSCVDFKKNEGIDVIKHTFQTRKLANSQEPFNKPMLAMPLIKTSSLMRRFLSKTEEVPL